MVTVLDVDGQRYVEELSKELAKSDKIKAPEWSFYVKTGSHTAYPPIQQDFWIRRAASILRNLYVHGPKGVQRMRIKYGGRKKRGTKEEKTVRSGGKIIRTILKQLETDGFVVKVMKDKKKGRQLTPKALKFMDNLAYKVSKL